MASIPRFIVPALHPYLTNKNTGNCYEIATILWLARRAGTTVADYATLKPLIDEIAAAAPKATDKIQAAYKAHEATASGPGPGLTLEGQPVVDLRNVTQDDGDGGTGDLVAVLADGTERSISVCEAYGAGASSLKKCLKNPSCRGFGCGDAEVATFKATAAAAIPAYEAEMTAAFGADKTAWKRKPSRAATGACASVAASAAAVFNAKPAEERRALFANLLSLSPGKPVPADYICFVSKTTMRPTFYRFQPKTTGEPTVAAAGIYLRLLLDGEPVGQVQVKFNNGITSAIHSSWNATVDLKKVFAMESATL